MTREARIWTLSAIVLGGLLLAVCFHAWRGQGGLGYPYNTFLFSPADRGNDFYNIYRPVAIGHPYGAPTSVYFPFTYLPFFLTRFLNEDLSFVLVAGLFTWILSRLVWSAASTMATGSRNLVTVILTLLTYPYLFLLDRGNLEMMTFVFLAGFLAFLGKERPYVAAVFLAAAAAMKGYPAMFGLIFLARRQVRPFILTMVCAIAFTFSSAALYPGGIVESLAKLHGHLEKFTAGYMTPTGPGHFNAAGMQHNASYLGFVRTVEYIGVLPYRAVETFEKFYVAFAAIAGLLVSFWIVFVERSLRRQMTLISTAVILLPQISFDYKLILLLFPVTLFLASEEPGRFDRMWIAIFGLLLIPKAYGWIEGDITISVILTPILLTAAAGLAIAEGLTSRTATAES